MARMMKMCSLLQALFTGRLYYKNCACRAEHWRYDEVSQ